MSEFLSRLGGAVMNDLKGVPVERILNQLMGGQSGAAGLQTLMERLRAGGLGDKVESWISGQDKPVSPQELEKAIGPGEADRMAQQAGMEKGGMLGLLSQVLPRLVNAMTPQGRMPAEGEETAQGGFGAVLGSVLGALGGAGATQTSQGQSGAIPTSGEGAAPQGGAGGDAARNPGIGAGGDAGMPRLDQGTTSDATAPASGQGGPPQPRGTGPERQS